ncbi:MAG: 2-amino-4-hydroxy-6-hydroxymethyldihydropteridine diphosphokinase [Bacillota bacterium]|nr:2-amino-4-hydroxy-6-hydroxymethyldihydropteridine diphosphokinase [Bacillota bacterium]
MVHKVYLGLGSNIGDKEKNLKTAIDYISQIKDTTLKSISPIYKTKPVGYTAQDDFLNAAVLIETGLEPLEVLSNTRQIENRMGRIREIHWGPRIIDIDILLYDELQINHPELTVPHPLMFQRAFVLRPLKDIYTSVRILGFDIDELILKCDDRNDIDLYNVEIRN